jgi:hypothetical protein
LSSPSASGASGLNPFGVQFSPEEEEEFNAMARSEGFYERFSTSVAPSIFGSLGTFCLTTLYTSASHLTRYQEGYFLPSLWRIKEGVAGWYALKRRH